MSTNASYGVPYSPSQASKFDGPRTIDELKSDGIKYIRLTWVDLVNNIRYRVIPLAYFAKLLESPRPGITIGKIVLGLVFLTQAEGFGPVGEYLYVPDMATLRKCPYAPGHASVMGFFQEKEQNELGSFSVDLCPRTMLQRVVQDAKKTCNVEFLVGVETEFILLKSVDPIEAVNNHGWSNSPALPSGAVETKVLEEIADSLQEAGIELQMYHAEAAPGQYEVITGPLTPLEACDALVFTRETIYNTASKHGLRATLAPRVFGHSCGSGAHTHVSIHSSSPPSLPPSTSPALPALSASFLQGLLTALPPLCALTLPTEASYARMLDGVWSGGTYVAWGTDNREAPVRLCPASSPHFEIKCVDGTCCPYVAFAGLLGAGLQGVKDKQALNIGECKDVAPALLSEQERERLQIRARMPKSIAEARERLCGVEGRVIRQVLGEHVVQAYVNVNKVCNVRLCSLRELISSTDVGAVPWRRVG
ncbi:glutamine synthetase/guanido kinase [Gloeophyllum trabeum ATCC 11539]|uniref:Glutamine synthetase n=1 Tax=Gloeophyllum trabeum (strain ATCC 11539 / FP-39264 / Madison 617) TaxID=670483 RepID=S7Q4I2_GLOTA|nr:glutamine synthetase/guanido kinase [Gloeophyllum trabeum ATCC 11539]EPQ54931.1 glutamine synthetase/guanido kinase [Gloeophyllum trabeum ATCC 11539]